MEPEKLLQFQVPEVGEVEVYIIKLPDGRIVARTKDELEASGISTEKKEEEGR